MSQTPTKGPFEVHEMRGETGKLCFHAIILGNSTCLLSTWGGPNLEVAETCTEALNIHHETKQTPRQILESREALRAALEEIDATPIPMVQCPDTLKFVLRQIGKIASKALTLAKEGGPA